MKYTEALSQLLIEHKRQVKQPELWRDNPWKNTYYGLLNKAYDKLEGLGKVNSPDREAGN